MDLADLQTPFGLGDNEVRPAENRVLRGGIAHSLEPKSMAVLLELARRTGETVSRDDLISAVWPRGYVTDGVLSRCISHLRGALGDDSKSPVYIATVPRKGYRLLIEPMRERATAETDGILVLPFQTLAAHGDDGYLADGLTELLIARLAAAVEQRVVSRTTAMTLKGGQHDTRWVRERLRVKWVVEGSLFQAGDDLQIIVQLIDAEQDAHLWANTWTRPARGVMHILNEVTREVTTHISQRLEPIRAPALNLAGLPVELERRYLQGLHHMSRRSAPSLHKSLQCFTDVLTSRSDHAPALAGAALAYVLLAHYGQMDASRAMQQARSYATGALAVDPENAEALGHMGAILFFHDWNFDKAFEYIDASLKRRPNYEISLLLAADIHLVMGHFDRSQAMIDLAVNTDPLNVGLLMNAGDLLILQRRYPEAVRSLAQAVEIEPAMRPAHLRMAMAQGLAGDPAAARRSLEQALRIAGEDAVYREYEAIVESSAGNAAAATAAARRLQAMAEGGTQVSSWGLARAWAAAGDEDAALACLARACAQRSTSMPFLGASPIFDSLREQEAAKNLMRQVGLPLFQME